MGEWPSHRNLWEGISSRANFRFATQTTGCSSRKNSRSRNKKSCYHRSGIFCRWATCSYNRCWRKWQDWDVLQILDEPTAAALAYKLERFKEDARKVLIFDLGGGTFDISILEMDGGNIKILNKDGDTHLGGKILTKAMMQ
ncbi:Chaperone protein DnaK [Orchesella cincta]|uniref:Chaperone protein DnaK n=1 Tax=Orchesella cincta TaxID=48709 RepID=A0A1D2MIV1_ORCCI|nr:Chaperone protein DnaK [Orchesella cincta]